LIGLVLLGMPLLAAAVPEVTEEDVQAAWAELLTFPPRHSYDVNPHWPLMHLACERHTPVPVFRKLIAQGFDVNQTDGIGQTPLHTCARSCAECIPVLVEGGARVDQGDQLGRTPLEIAWDVKNLATAEALLRAGANPNIDNRDGLSPYWFALYQDYRPEMAELMARYGGRLSIGQRLRHYLRQMEPSNLFSGHHR
jgi:ankyrin repeat protein